MGQTSPAHSTAELLTFHFHALTFSIKKKKLKEKRVTKNNYNITIHASWSKFMYIARAVTRNGCVGDCKEPLAVTCGSTTSALYAYTTADVFHNVSQKLIKRYI